MPPTFGDLKRYCEKTGWRLVRDTDHWYYEKVLPSGEVLRTRVSHAVRKDIPSNLWRKIVKHQLKVAEDEFWRAL